MGGAVSSGRDNNELVDNLMNGNYIRTRAVERVFRVLDRADYMSAEARDQAYKDLAWRNGPLHLSAPCIYSEVMEALELKPGLSFLNVGSGTGYLSTMVGLIIGSSGISHGVEAVPVVSEYANKKLGQFIENSVTLDEFDFCMPKYYTGNGLCLAPTHTYDRVYCGAGVLSKYENYFKQFIKVGGVLVMPLADTLVQLRRVSASHWTKRNLLNVSFALLRDPAKDELDDLLRLDEQSPSSLQILSRAAIRAAMRAGLTRRHPELREPPAAPARPPRAGPRRVCIPCDTVSDEEVHEFHDLDEAGGAREMNALLSLVLSMGQNRAAGSLRLDPVADAAGDDFADVGVDALYTLDRRTDGEGALLPDSDLIVLDVGGAAVRARRWPPRAPPAPDTNRSSATTASQTETIVAPGPSYAPAPDAEADGEEAEMSGDNDADSRTKTDTRTDSDTNTKTDSKADSGSKTKTDSKTGTDTKTKSDETEAEAKVRSSRTVRTRTLTRAAVQPALVLRRRSPPRAPWTDSSSDDEDVTQVKERKRQKLDSGIGEGTASSASPGKSGGSSATDSSNTDDDEGAHDTDMPSCDGDELESGTVGSCEASDGDDDVDDDDDGDDGGDDGAARDVEMGADRAAPRLKLKRKKLAGRGATRADIRKRMVEAAASRRRAEAGPRSHSCSSGSESGAGGPRGPPPARDLRRVRLSLAMKRGIKELPLPHALKKYVNYGRCYQF